MFCEPPGRMHLAFAALLLWAAGSAAQVPPEVSGAWVRGTVPGQHATGAYMSITSADDVALVGAETPVAQSAEVHQMSMTGNVMNMRPVARLAVPAGGRVDLKPGGYHLMLMGLKAPLKTGDRVPLKLFFESKDRQRREIAVQAEVRGIAAK
jgi:copper(I)-binding protein